MCCRVVMGGKGREDGLLVCVVVLLGDVFLSGFGMELL